MSNIDSKVLAVLRKSRGWSQEELAELTDLSSRTIQRLERGQTASPETRLALANALNVDPTDLAKEDASRASAIQRGVKAGFWGVAIGYSCAFIAVSYDFFVGNQSGITAGLTLGTLGVLAGIFCAFIGRHSERSLNAA